MIDSLTLTFLVQELERNLPGQSLNAFYALDEETLKIELSGVELKFLHRPTAPALFWTDQKVETPRLPLPRFENTLRGCKVESVVQVDLDRVIKMDLISEDSRRFRLYFELTSPFVNLFLTDEQDIVLAILLKRGTSTKTRLIEVGKRYTAPPAHGKIHPFEISPTMIDSLPWEEDATVLSSCVMGISPFVSTEIVHRAKATGSLSKAFGEFIEAYRNHKIKPCVCKIVPYPQRMTPHLAVTWFEPTLDRVEVVSYHRSVNEAMKRALELLFELEAFWERKSDLVSRIKKEIARIERIDAEARDAQARKEEVHELRRMGELILANLQRIKKGQKEVELEDIYSPEAAVIEVKLEPHLTPHENAELYFKKARKLERRLKILADKAASTRVSLEKLRSLLNRVVSANDSHELKSIEEALPEIAPSEKRRQIAQDEKALKLGINPRRFIVEDGWLVLVGRSARENDILTHRYATPSDIWFHARQAQGAHVILRREKKKAQPSRGAILQAAAIAAYYSKARTSKHVPVSYAEKRYVKRVRRAPAGTCVMLREKVVFVDPALPQKETI